MEIHSDANATAPMYETLIGQMVQVVVEELDPEQAILFGSCGRGDAVASSDVDLLVVLSTPFGTGRERVSEEARLWRALAKFHVPKDVLVCSREEVEYWRVSLNHGVARALREGRILYERH